MIVVKNSVLEQNPGLLLAVYQAFSESKQTWLAEQGSSPPAHEDPMPIGMSQTRASLEALMQYSMDQKILPKRLDLDEIFPRNLD
jgi:hypothetical protein